MQISIPIVTRVQDNGDGGYSIYCYNTEEEMLKDHPKAHRFNVKTKKDEIIDLTDEEIEQILNGHDEYENGYIDDTTILFELDLQNLTAKLAQDIYFHAGQ